MAERRELSPSGEFNWLTDFALQWRHPDVIRDEIVDLVRKTCGALDPALMCAIVEQESGFDPWAIRYEAAFYARYVKPIVGLSDTEAHARAISWGLFQVIGQTAREVGFKGPLPQLCSPETGIAVGCEVFNAKMRIARGSVEQALLFWNGGSNKAYPGQVMARLSKFA